MIMIVVMIACVFIIVMIEGIIMAGSDSVNTEIYYFISLCRVFHFLPMMSPSVACPSVRIINAAFFPINRYYCC